MAWTCADCNKPESKKSDIKIETVCHHCGRPLCQKDSIRVLDPDFSDHDGPVSRIAIHCHECKKANHPALTEYIRSS